jgi:hypothetical protein
MSRKRKRQVSKSAAFIPTQRTTEFNPDYTYVKRDLRRIGTLAGTFFVLLVGLALVLR